MKPTPRLAAAAVAIGLVAASCSSGGGSQLSTIAEPAATDPPATEPPAADTVEDTEEAAAPAPTSDDASATDEPADEAQAQPEAEEEPAPEPAGENQLPVVPMVDLATGGEVTLASFAPAETPIVLWFWAPH